jgi:hypothetical protein
MFLEHPIDATDSWHSSRVQPPPNGQPPAQHLPNSPPEACQAISHKMQNTGLAVFGCFGQSPRVLIELVQ